MQPAPQDNQLMSKHRVLSLKPQLRLEWRGQDGQNETEQPHHSASLGDSIPASTQIRFSVHTRAFIGTDCSRLEPFCPCVYSQYRSFSASLVATVKFALLLRGVTVTSVGDSHDERHVNCRNGLGRGH